MKKIFAIVVATPILALFVGIGVWSLKVADTWTPANTEILIGGMISACTTGGIVVALGLSAVITLVFYSHWQRNTESIPLGWGRRETLQSSRQPSWREIQPPMLTTTQPAGEWHSRGPEIYDLWKEEPSEQMVDREWK